jgi:sulfur carrier protein
VNLRVNGEPRQVPSGLLLADLVTEVNGSPVTGGVAAAVNGEVVPRSQWRERALSEGDRIEILGATQGG